MGTLDATMRALAKSLISDKGRTVTLRRETRTNDSTQGKVTSVVTDYTVKISPPSPYDTTRLTDTTIIEGDLECIIAADGTPVTPNAKTDKIIMGSSVWQIVRVSPYSSGELDAAYSLQIRQ